jgi:hypothetical protein
MPLSETGWTFDNFVMEDFAEVRAWGNIVYVLKDVARAKIAYQAVIYAPSNDFSIGSAV